MNDVPSLKTIQDVIGYWEQCLLLLDSGEDERRVAGRMVNVVNSRHELEWSEGRYSHPSYQLIFELAASLELPTRPTDRRLEQWDCIRALLPVLRQSAAQD